jgi:hypothetical protein
VDLFCQRYDGYRLEYTAGGELLILPGNDLKSGNRNAYVICQLGN